jgi:hypothetical protein
MYACALFGVAELSDVHTIHSITQYTTRLLTQKRIQEEETKAMEHRRAQLHELGTPGALFFTDG